MTRAPESAPSSYAADIAFTSAVKHYRAGELGEAAAGYRGILKADPDHFDAVRTFLAW